MGQGFHGREDKAHRQAWEQYDLSVKACGPSTNTALNVVKGLVLTQDHVLTSHTLSQDSCTSESTIEHYCANVDPLQSLEC